MYPTKKQSAYLTHHMKKVSRSFALVVSYLEEPLRQQMSTAYLICRVLDNIEDCGQLFWWKEKRFAEAQYVLALPYTAKGYRMASLMCLLPAYQTIALAARRHRQLFTAEHKCKISRLTMMKCQLNARSMMADNEAGRRMSHQAQLDIANAFDNNNYVQRTAVT